MATDSESIQPAPHDTHMAPDSTTGVTFENPEENDIEKINAAVQEIGGSVAGSEIPIHTATGDGIELPKTPAIEKTNPATLDSNPKAYEAGDTEGWLSKFLSRMNKKKLAKNPSTPPEVATPDNLAPTKKIEIPTQTDTPQLIEEKPEEVSNAA